MARSKQGFSGNGMLNTHLIALEYIKKCKNPNRSLTYGPLDLGLVFQFQLLSKMQSNIVVSPDPPFLLVERQILVRRPG